MTPLTANFMQLVPGSTRCIRCDWRVPQGLTSEAEHDVLMAHLERYHPNWQTDKVTSPGVPVAAQEGEPQEDAEDVAEANKQINEMMASYPEMSMRDVAISLWIRASNERDRIAAVHGAEEGGKDNAHSGQPVLGHVDNLRAGNGGDVAGNAREVAALPVEGATKNLGADLMQEKRRQPLLRRCRNEA